MERYLKQNTKKPNHSIIFKFQQKVTTYINIHFDSTVLIKTTIQVLSYRSITLLCKVCSVVSLCSEFSL